jgi:succinyl-diaminopimelate desuccinylase
MSVFELARELIRRASVTPDDAGCQALIGERLAAAGFALEAMPFGEVSNLWATHGRGAPLLVFAGHTDVVPPGPRENWQSDPFVPSVRDELLYGRGAADMKGGLAAMIEAAAAFVAANPRHRGTLAFLITSDEEGAARDGTRRVMEALDARAIEIDYCLVGEPSSVRRAGDEIRIGRRGSLTGFLTVHGEQGHVAYPERADNAAHRLVAALGELAATEWPAGDQVFPPLSFQIANVAAGTGANNVIPGAAEAQFNFRYPPPIEPGELQRRTAEIVARHAPRHEIAWRDSGRPFLSRSGALRGAVSSAIAAETGIAPKYSTGGGTSDGRFIAPIGAEVVELGPRRGPIHKANEYIALADLAALTRMYAALLESLLAPALETRC